MPWETIDLETWAKELGVNINELRQKDQLIDRSVKARKQLGLTQTQLAKLVGVSQPRIAQIENRVKMGKITFDTLLHILDALGHDYKITMKKVRKPNLNQVAA